MIRIRACLGIFACSGMFLGLLQAAPPSLRPSNQPAISPYLNLLNNTQPLEVNYFLRTAPEIEMRNATESLGTSLNRLEGDVYRDEVRQSLNSNLKATGHSVSFMSLGGYYGGGAGGTQVRSPSARKRTASGFAPGIGTGLSGGGIGAGVSGAGIGAGMGGMGVGGGMY